VDALETLNRLVALKPDNAIAWSNRGNLLLELGRAGDAIASYDRALALKSDFADAWHNRAVARMTEQNFPAAEADLTRALALKPDHANALEHRGLARASQGRYAEALQDYDAAVKLSLENPGLLCRRADALLHLGHLERAAADYESSLALAPANPDAWLNRGVALSRQGAHRQALESYDQALRLKPDMADAWHNRGSVLLALKDHEGALSSYDKALAIRPAYAEALKSRGIVLTMLQRNVQALADFDAALSLHPEDAAAWEGRANALSRLERQEEALASYDEALKLNPKSPDGLYNRANTLSLLKRFEESARDCETLLEIEPHYPYGRGLLMHARLNACDWRGLDEARGAIAAALRKGERVIHPFGYLPISTDPGDQLRCARILAGDHFPASATPLWRGDNYAHDKIRVAYLSADFYTHATAFLTAGVFEHHDRSRFETIAVSFGPNDFSDMRARLEGAFGRFLDVQDETDAAVAARLRALEIDIAVDLKGYTGRARPGILSFRPAPVQAHYLGYPGSMGADYIDYLIADAIVVPEEHRKFYAEQIAYLPDTYQCNDSLRRVAARTPSRAEAGLPDRGFVFCCFNSNYKIMPEMFDIWMRLVGGVEESVLWLFEENAGTAANLRREAQARGITAERLIFAKRVSLDEHLARLKCADLVLDTLPYGAHTTASDALWVGVPVLTCLGSTFPGRVAASLLTAIGLPELITPSLEGYERRARELAQDAAALGAIKANLERNRSAYPLFDTARITRNLEAAYAEMWKRQQRGERPQSFTVRARSAPENP
jgi:predicted O-linked N-acetylglucosamine transferase (SPINDLY family)